MKKFWWTLLALEVGAVAAFSYVAATSDYFLKMPDSVRRGQSLASLVAPRAAGLAALLCLMNVSILLWLTGGRSIVGTQRQNGIIALVASVALFIFAAYLSVTWVLFSFPRW